MGWSWTKPKRRSVVAMSWVGTSIAYLQGRFLAQGKIEIVKAGVLHQGSDTDEAFFQRLQGLGLSGCVLRFMLRPDQYQMLQIDAPEVPPDEIRSATRWKIRDLVDAHLDDLTVDVCRVGDAQTRNSGQLFVVVARNDLVRSMTQLGQRLQCRIQAIDVWDMAQRNLQALVARKGLPAECAEAAVVVIDSLHSLLTISVQGELFYSRRIELAKGFMESRWLHDASVDALEADSFEQVPEYLPSDEFQHLDSMDHFHAAQHGVGVSVDDGAQRFVVEVQRSLDVWERTWSALPIDGLKVYAGSRSSELAMWLGREMGVQVTPLDLTPYFPGFANAARSDTDQAWCWPLLGALLRDDARRD